MTNERASIALVRMYATICAKIGHPVEAFEEAIVKAVSALMPQPTETTPGTSRAGCDLCLRYQYIHFTGQSDLLSTQAEGEASYCPKCGRKLEEV